MVADRLGYTYIDSGAMYRALAWAAQEAGITREDEGEVIALARTISIRLVAQPGGANRVIVECTDVTDEIRSQETGQLASQLSEIREVRQRMVAIQQEMAKEGGVVMEGRDIQTVVLPGAEVKIFLTASAEERAKRRHLELVERGVSARYEDILAEIKQRDERDSNREHSPLKPAPDAVWVNTDGLSIEQVAERVLAIMERRQG
jgi:cytidylate kinase